ncbi:hypothetical protein [Microbacterium sp. SORGH_AS_0888]|uniref:hypothetical protein n=1 Tax=Microbacterium sp. SORGH_AS_0888 TaxID=3041791 RepID=UPI0027819C42|nr:hypothetical protein [Microbacterium sp. SORGH_AS_0888]MDQ1128999.1 hypothetical protein [Microbacterium sp. SORGH_AS_0888]
MARKNTPPWKHRTSRGQDQRQRAVPPVLPQIVLKAVSADTLIATVNGDRINATPIARTEVHTAVTELVAHLGAPTRVEVRELDGTVYADILTPPAQAADGRAASEPDTARRAAPELVEFAGDGYVAGEDVAIAVILRHTSADHTGHARALLDRAELADASGELILLGRISETLSIHRTD